jgi:outer membrane lipoprotein-sorting protein
MGYGLWAMGVNSCVFVANCLYGVVRMTFSRLTVSIILLGALLNYGCAPAPRVPLDLPPGLEDALVRQMQDNAQAYYSVQGFARVWVRAEGRSAGGRQVVIVREPNLFRTEILSPFGQPVMQIAADGRELTAILPADGIFFTGEATFANVSRFTRLPLALEEMVALMLYRVPFDPHSERELTSRHDGYLLTLRGALDYRQELLFDTRLRLVRADWYEGERLLLRAEYADFLRSTPPFPQSLSLAVPGQDMEAVVNFTEIDLNTEIPEERFRLAPPRGYRVQMLD